VAPVAERVSRADLTAATAVPFALALGSSLGDGPGLLGLAVRALVADPDVRLTGWSRVYRTPPAGGVARGAFHNAAVAGLTRHPAYALLESCRAIEARLGRRHARRWADRALDIDVLLYGAEVLVEPSLVVPHPRMRERDFVLVPLAEAWPDARDPRDGSLLAALPAARGRLPAVALLPCRLPRIVRETYTGLDPDARAADRSAAHRARGR
jgi:2-amino-4-hydroxy-6-hydroxymethyldihydropteridine diphosphokinase